MLDAVGWTLPDAREQLAIFQWKPEQRPAPFRHGQSKSLQYESDGWIESGGRLNLKYSRVQSERIDVATVMVYPTGSPDRLPIFGGEWVVVSGRCHLLVLDLETAGVQPSLVTELRPLMMPVVEKWSAVFPWDGGAPEWFRDIAQPWALCSSCPQELLPQLREAYREYLSVAIDAFYRPRLEQAQSLPEAPEVTAYKMHHFEHSPGRKLLSREFPPEFVDTFLKDWHFGPAG